MTTHLLSDETRGRTRLRVVFWIHGVLASHLAFGAILYAYRQVGTPQLALMSAVFIANRLDHARCATAP